ncbi:hypothetical protein Tco_1513487, partial [Tanacetum coccineum]
CSSELTNSSTYVRTLHVPLEQAADATLLIAVKKKNTNGAMNDNLLGSMKKKKNSNGLLIITVFDMKLTNEYSEGETLKWENRRRYMDGYSLSC